jgi:hypothetical protein
MDNIPLSRGGDLESNVSDSADPKRKGAVAILQNPRFGYKSDDIPGFTGLAIGT